LVEGNIMSYLLSQASSYTESSSSKKNPRMQNTFANIQREQQYKKKTISHEFEEHNKAQESREKVVQDIILKETKFQPEEESGLTDFSPSVFTNNNNPDSKLIPRFVLENGPYSPSTNRNNNNNNTPNPVSQQQIRSSYSDSYSPTPYYKGLSASNKQVLPPHNSQLMEKLNYMIRLLEEQQKEPTQNIMEEFVLYGLLGVFMIYLVDSFSKAGKYIR
jgi:hypothetical protein